MRQKFRNIHPAWIIIAIVITAAALALASHYLHKNQPTATKNSNPTTHSQPSEDKASQTSSTPEDINYNYLTIKEWGVHTPLPQDMEGLVWYTLGEMLAGPDGNQIQAAKIMIKADAVPGANCATTNTASGQAVDTGIQYVRSEAAKPFNASRYRWTFKENILRDANYAYHLNYVTPDCMGAAANKIEALQSTLVKLQRTE